MPKPSFSGSGNSPPPSNKQLQFSGDRCIRLKSIIIFLEEQGWTISDIARGLMLTESEIYLLLEINE